MKRSLQLWTTFLVLALAGYALADVQRWLGIAEVPFPPPQAFFGDSLRPSSGLLVAAGAACVVLWCVWQWTAAANVRDRVRHELRLGHEADTPRHDRWGPPRFGPGSIGWWFVPVANLWTPFRAVKELWDRSHALDGRTRGSRPILWLWWLLVLSIPLAELPVEAHVHDLIRPFHPGMSHDERVSIVLRWTGLLTARDIVACGVAAYVVWRINALQEAWPPVDLDAVAGPRS